MKKLLSMALFLGMATLLMNHRPATELMPSETTAELCVAPGNVGMLATMPENCQSTVHAFSNFATGANWTVSGGNLVSGQGTLEIVISANSFFGSNVTVTCRAFNECGYSPNTVSRTYFISCP